jgi:hypothetical protein
MTSKKNTIIFTDDDMKLIDTTMRRMNWSDDKRGFLIGGVYDSASKLLCYRDGVLHTPIPETCRVNNKCHCLMRNTCPDVKKAAKKAGVKQG